MLVVTVTGQGDNPKPIIQTSVFFPMGRDLQSMTNFDIGSTWYTMLHIAVLVPAFLQSRSFCNEARLFQKSQKQKLGNGFNPSENISQIGSFPEVMVKIKFLKPPPSDGFKFSW